MERAIGLLHSRGTGRAPLHLSCVHSTWFISHGGKRRLVQLFPLDILEDFFNMLSMGLKIVTKL